MRVAVTGSCASGKSTVVAALREHGIDAYSVAQEHSIISDLWNHLSPDRVVYLAVRLETVRARRDDPNWPAWLFDIQQQRLADARRAADVVVTTDGRGPDEVVKEILRGLPALP